MPPKRSARKNPATAPAPKRSKLAKEHSITDAQIGEITEAFQLFAVRAPVSSPPPPSDEEEDEAGLGAGRRRKRNKGKGRAKDKEEDDQLVLRRADVRRCLIALGLGRPSAEMPEVLEVLDPLDTGRVEWEGFLGYAALLMNQKADQDEDGEENENEEYEDGDRGARNAEIDEAWGLFTHGQEGPITLAHLRMIARELREEVPEALLKDMILVANGSDGDGGVRKGVKRGEWEGVMRRVGVFS